METPHVATTLFDDLFVLELANNHWGRLDRGLKIIQDFAHVVQANGVHAAIKLQFRDVGSFIHKDFRHRSDIRYIQKTLDTHLSWPKLQMMVDAVREAGMVTMATPFDEVSVGKCVEFGVEILKIASSDIKDWGLLDAVARTGKPVIASAGGASLEDLDRLVTFFERRGNPFALNHCVSIYPSDDGELDLNQVDFLKARYPAITIGLSTHEHRDWSLSVAIAYAKGARTFERHIDIEADGVAVSPYCSRPEQADTWFKAFHTAKAMCGGAADVKRQPPEKEVRYLDALVRGVYARRDLPAGHVLCASDVYLAVPLLKGQISGREFVGGERLTAPVMRDGAIDLAEVDCDYGADTALAGRVADRGLEHLVEAEALPIRAVG